MSSIGFKVTTFETFGYVGPHVNLLCSLSHTETVEYLREIKYPVTVTVYEAFDFVAGKSFPNGEEAASWVALRKYRGI